MRLEIVAAVNDNNILSANLAYSPLIREGQALLHVEQGYSSASLAYLAGLQKCTEDIVIFAHQDVYIPAGWENKLKQTIKMLANRGEKWGVIGVFGMDSQGECCGQVWSSGLNRELVFPADYPHPVVSVDELLIVLNRKSGIMFDAALPAFHLYGTDIVLTALQHNYGAFVFRGPVIHNSTRVRYLDASYGKAYHHMARKWWLQLPLRNCIVPVTKNGLPLYVSRLKRLKKIVFGKKSKKRSKLSPTQVAQKLRYENQ